ncbi:MAG: hypothetical protein QNJ70_19905 [Xenococcaceae cyanobacterium MO_207.B15]|nr:hypothetical protein [Xenococcaceae cyanobacterium MO_207.B15]
MIIGGVYSFNQGEKFLNNNFKNELDEEKQLFKILMLTNIKPRKVNKKNGR